MIYIAALALVLGAQASPDPTAIRCMYDAVGMDRMQAYSDQLDAKTLTVEQFAAATAPERSACVKRGVWKLQKHVDVGFTFALSMAQFVAAGKQLEAGGISPDAVLGKWDAMPTALRAAMKAGTDSYPGGTDKFVPALRAFLIAQTPAKQAPHLGNALELLMSYGAMLRADDEFTAAGKPQP